MDLKPFIQINLISANILKNKPIYSPKSSKFNFIEKVGPIAAVTG